MIDAPIACARGCLRHGRHASDCDQQDDHAPGCVNDQCDGCNTEQCPGCMPREAETGLLCRGCTERLETLLAGPDDRESVAGACEWLADNLGQHLRSAPMGGTGRSANPGEGFVTVMAALRDMQVGFAEFAADFLASRSMRPLEDTSPAHIAARLRPWLGTIAAWEPIADTLDLLIAWRGQAHGVCPWRGREPEATMEMAAMLHLAPAEDTAATCRRFRVTGQWLKDAKRRRGLMPVSTAEKPYRYRPFDVFAALHPDAAEEYLAELSRLEQYDSARSEMVWSSEEQDIA